LTTSRCQKYNKHFELTCLLMWKSRPYKSIESVYTKTFVSQEPNQLRLGLWQRKHNFVSLRIVVKMYS